MTTLIYLTDPNLFTATAKIEKIIDTERGLAAILDKTIFYVQGGGQPGDRGTIRNQNGSFEILKTVPGHDGDVWHLISRQEGEIQPGQEVELKIDSEFRINNSQRHSAGHLLDLSIAKVGLKWKPTKGYHFPDGSYVEYEVDTDPGINDALINQIQSNYDLLVDSSLDIKIEIDSTQTFHGQPLRTITFEGQSPCPCGGTHASNTSQLAGFKVTKMKWKNGIVKVSYTKSN